MRLRLLKLLALVATLAAAGAVAAAQADSGPPWGPETPQFNLEAVLRPVGASDGFGLVKFRQPNDANTTIYLDVWVRDLLPNRTYFVQRAVDTTVDNDCTGSNWTMPTLGTIMTDGRGTGRAALVRPVPASLLGTEFDIHFRVAETQMATSGVLQSGCYQYTVSQ